MLIFIPKPLTILHVRYSIGSTVPYRTTCTLSLLDIATFQEQQRMKLIRIYSCTLKPFCLYYVFCYPSLPIYCTVPVHLVVGLSVRKVGSSVSVFRMCTAFLSWLDLMSTTERVKDIFNIVRIPFFHFV